MKLATQAEVRLLLKARRLVEKGIPYICSCLETSATSRQGHIVDRLIAEVLEFPDGYVTVASWLDCASLKLAQQFRLAIIDTMLVW